jgi:hypothetical protein
MFLEFLQFVKTLETFKDSLVKNLPDHLNIDPTKFSVVQFKLKDFLIFQNKSINYYQIKQIKNFIEVIKK